MALNDKNLIVTPNIGSTNEPKIDFVGASTNTGPSTITAVVYPTNSGTLSFQGTEGTLFSITNSLSSGSIFSVNPISGIPIIDVNADRTIALNPFGGNTGIGITNPTSKLQVVGDGRFTGVLTATTFSGQVNAGVSTIGVATATNLTTQQLNVSGVSTHTGISTFQSTLFGTQASFTGVVTANTFIGAVTGTATTATKLQNARDFSITGSFVTASAISFDGTGNVALAATIVPDSIGLGTYTSGDYVKDISGTSNQITVTGGTGEGSSPTLSLPNNLVVPQDLTVTRDLQVNRNLNVDGNITIGGTAAFINVQELKVYDPDLVLGFRTDANNNDISTDNTANHGGIAIASTEGTPLIDLFIAGIETNPSTYKKIMWFKEGTFAGLGTDAWLSNYAVGIGSTQFPIGTRLASGNVQFTENDLAVVRDINASGIVTGNTANFTNATLTNISSSGISTLGITSATDLTAQQLNVSGVATVGSNFLVNSGTLYVDATNNRVGINTLSPIQPLHINSRNQFIPTIVSIATTIGISTTLITGISTSGITIGLEILEVSNIIASGTTVISIGSSTVGIGTTTLNVGVQTNVSLTFGPRNDSRVFVVTGIGSVGIGTTNPTAKLHIVGDINIDDGSTYSTIIQTQTPSANRVITYPDATGTVALVAGSSGQVTYNQSGINTGDTNFTYTASGGLVLTTNLNATGISTLTTLSGTNATYTTGNFTTGNIVTGVVTTLTSTNATLTNINSTGIGTIANVRSTTLSNTGVATFTNGPVLIGSGTSTGTASQPLQVTGGAYVSGNLGVGVTSPTVRLQVAAIGSVGVGQTIAFFNDVNNNERISIIDETTSSQKPPGFRSRVATYGLGLYANSGPIIFYRGASDTASGRIDTSGNFLINTAIATGTTSQPLQVTGGAYVSGSVGFGTTNPIQPLQVNSGSNVVVIDSMGDIGIGTTNPTSKLQVVGDGRFTGVVTATTFNGQVNAGVSTFTSTVSIASSVGIGTVIKLIPYDTVNSGTLSFEASAGQLFSVTNNLTSGSIFAVNDVSGIPSIDVNVDGTISLTPFADGNVGIATTRPTSRLHIVGDALITGIVTASTGRLISGIGVSNNGVSIGTTITTIDFTGSGISTVTASAGIATINITADISPVMMGMIF